MVTAEHEHRRRRASTSRVRCHGISELLLGAWCHTDDRSLLHAGRGFGTRRASRGGAQPLGVGQHVWRRPECRWPPDCAERPERDDRRHCASRLQRRDADGHASALGTTDAAGDDPSRSRIGLRGSRQQLPEHRGASGAGCERRTGQCADDRHFRRAVAGVPR